MRARPVRGRRTSNYFGDVTSPLPQFMLTCDLLCLWSSVHRNIADSPCVIDQTTRLYIEDIVPSTPNILRQRPVNCESRAKWVKQNPGLNAGSAISSTC